MALRSFLFYDNFSVMHKIYILADIELYFKKLKGCYVSKKHIFTTYVIVPTILLI